MVRRTHHTSRVGFTKAALLVGLLLIGLITAALVVAGPRGLLFADRQALSEALTAPNAAFMQPAYAGRKFRPIWLEGRKAKPEATRLIQALEHSQADGLPPSRYNPEGLKRQLDGLGKSSKAQRAKTELLLSYAYVRYVRDLHTPAAASDLAYTDHDFQPEFRRAADIVDDLAAAKSLGGEMQRSFQMNPLYVEMRRAMQADPGGMAVADRRRVLFTNLERLRALPPHLGDHFVLVNVAASRLWLYADGKPVDTMKVVVGAKAHATPQMAALIRYSVFNPYWNVPPDLTRDVYAPRIAARRSALADLHMDAWSDYTPDAKQLDPDVVNWRAVAAGAAETRLRQRPGLRNSMGAVKFMFPNALGIYLHDTPDRSLFSADQRTFSAGCIRVEDYKRLGRWLFGGRDAGPKGSAPEQRIDLPRPVPVYILYLTAAPQDLADKAYRDPYGRDVM